MPSYLVVPPPFQQRMAFMDALEEAGIDYSREREGYFIFLRQGQEETWEGICRQFETEFSEEEPTSEMDPIMD